MKSREYRVFTGRPSIDSRSREKLSAALSSGHTTNIGSSSLSYSAAARFTLCMPESPETSAGSPPLSIRPGRAAASLFSNIC